MESPVRKQQSMATGKTPDKPTPTGWVSFVGGGPGDPGLLTVRAVELLRSAEVVVTEAPEHEAMVRTVLGLPTPEPVEEGQQRPVALLGRRRIAPGI